MPAGLQLRVDQLTVYCHLKASTLRRDEPDRLNIPLELLGEFGHQTDGSLGVVSDHTVFDTDVHHGPPSGILSTDSTMRTRR
jgi:hypothetical protein